MNPRPVIALDVGGSSVKSGLVSPGALPVVIRTHPIDSGAPAQSIGTALAHVITLNAHSSDVEFAPAGVGIAFPGPCDYARGIVRIRDVGKFDSLYGHSLPELVRAHLPVKMHFEIRLRNDAEASILAEAAIGAGASLHHVLGVTLGTGIGSANIVAGKPRTIPTPYRRDGFLYDWPWDGEVADGWFSTRGILRIAQECGTDSESPAALAARAHEGDRAALNVFCAFGRQLGLFLAAVADFLRPDGIVVGGGISAAYELFGPVVEEVCTVPVRRASLGAAGALIGAAMLFE